MNLEEELTRQVAALSRDNEIKRILACGQYDHYAVLDILPEEASLIKKVYRKKSILIHPDKTDNVDAPAAFDRLKKAEQFVSDDGEELKRLNLVYEDVQSKLTDMVKVREKVSLILEDIVKEEQVEKMYQQRLEVNRQAEAVKVQLERQLKKKMELKWEDAREERVLSWRKFSGKVEKKRKKKVLA